jgi:hypothetical protein
MTKKEFIDKYRGNFPGSRGRDNWASWDDIEKDMDADLDLVLKHLSEPKSEPAVHDSRDYNPADYRVLNPETCADILGKDEIAVGVVNFGLLSKPALMEYYHEGHRYLRKHTGTIPDILSGEVCSVHIYHRVPERCGWCDEAIFPHEMISSTDGGEMMHFGCAAECDDPDTGDTSSLK